MTGLHEISEAQWIPSSKREMAIVGPIVRNDVFFFVFILGAAALLVLREWLAIPLAGAPAATANDAERRRVEWERRKQRRWMFAAAFTCLAVVSALAADFVYDRVKAAPPEARLVSAQGGHVAIPLAEVSDGDLHIYTVEIQGAAVRFLVIRKPNGWGTALDACQICGPVGYRQDASNVICRHCGSAIYVPSIGDAGGCNPVRLPSRVEAGELVIDLCALAQASTQVPK
ncbi:MAG: hypothetical protein DMG28_10440 [Acidobacteria bacterium]|nr:MAG: hypothetical protein DMG28_10440 [Acidobacteriota bacterium]